MTILANARGMRYEVGSNLKGHGIGAAWSLLLPSLDIDVAVVVGQATAAERTAVEHLASRSIVVDRPLDGSLDPVPDGHLDLVVLGRDADRLLHDPASRAALAARLSPRGAIYRERRGLQVRQATWPPNTLSLIVAPAFGPARVFVPSADAPTAARLASLGFLPPRGRQTHPQRALNRLVTAGPMRGRFERRVDLAVGAGAAAAQPAAYVADIAAAAGVDIGGAAWALVSPGDYASQKVLLLLFDGPERRPWTIVKLGSDPAHVGRLRNEAEALERLARLGLGGAATPVSRFIGEHAGRGVLGQSWLAGKPFNTVADLGAGSAQLSAATRWLIGLATATRVDVAAADVGAALRDLLQQFRATYPRLSNERAFLETQVNAVAAYGGSLPVGMQHGDPGTWNLLVDEAGGVAFLDWESAEMAGLPLWDLLHLQRSFGALAARRAGVRRRLGASVHHLVSASPLNARFAADLATFAETVGIPSTLLEPLFFTCWMHRALKEATRRTPASLHGGLYLRVLRRLIRERDAEPLRRLLGGAR